MSTLIIPADPAIFKPLEERFLRSVDDSTGPDACWPWVGARTVRGYGQLYVSRHPRVTVYAHRYALARACGGVLEGQALHTCDNPPCCNIRHLFKGDPAANAKDKEGKGRAAKALTLEQATAIKNLPHLPLRVVAERFGVHISTVHDIRTGYIWKDAPGPVVPPKFYAPRATSRPSSSTP